MALLVTPFTVLVGWAYGRDFWWQGGGQPEGTLMLLLLLFWLSVVGCRLWVVCCLLLFVVGCLLFVVCWFVGLLVCCLLFVVCCCCCSSSSSSAFHKQMLGVGKAIHWYFQVRGIFPCFSVCICIYRPLNQTYPLALQKPRTGVVLNYLHPILNASQRWLFATRTINK